MRILIIDDDKYVRDFLTKSLQTESFIIDQAEDGEQGSYKARTNEYDLIILDLMLPKRDGGKVCQEIRACDIHTPILMLSVSAAIDEKVNLLNYGADDFLTKPFALKELIARVRALLRRPQKIEPTVIMLNDLQIDSSRQRVHKGTKEVYLTRKEFCLLEFLTKHRGVVVSRGMIMEHVWNADTDPFSNTIEAHILNLRKKVDTDPFHKLIHTVPGRGYKLDIIKNSNMKDNYLKLLQESIQDKYADEVKAISHGSVSIPPSSSPIADIQLSVLPYIVWKSFPKKHNDAISLAKVHSLCFAAHCEWNGYNDNYIFSPIHSLHTYFSQHSYKIYKELLPQPIWQTYIDSIYLKKTEALLQTQIHYSTLFYENSGIVPLYTSKDIYRHKAQALSIATPLLLSSLYSLHNSEVQSLIQVIEHITLAYTLINDLYSWQSQLSQGYISSVSSSILSYYHELYKKPLVNLVSNTPELNDIFWHHTLDRALLEIVTTIEQCTESLEQCSLIKSPSNLLLFIKNLLTSIKKLQHQQELILSKSATNEPCPTIVQSPYM